MDDRIALTPAIESGYDVHIPYWVWPVAIVGLVAFTAYLGIQISLKLLVIAGLAELVIMVALGLSGLLSPGPAGFSFDSWNFGNRGDEFFLAVVFSIFAFSGWEGVAPVAEESKDPKRNVPRGLIGSMVVMLVYFGIVIWGYLVGIGASADSVAGAKDRPVLDLAHRVWAGSGSSSCSRWSTRRSPRRSRASTAALARGTGWHARAACPRCSARSARGARRPTTRSR
jgi:amino acid transporter